MTGLDYDVWNDRVHNSLRILVFFIVLKATAQSK
jgi:hypothetical protein